MSTFLRVLCRSGRPLPCSQVIDFIREGCYFGTPPVISPTSNHESGTQEIEWSVTIQYDRSIRPIIATCVGPGAMLEQEIVEIRTGLVELVSGEALLVASHVSATRRIIGIEIGTADLSDDAWAMIDCLESFVASQLDGIVYAPGDGFYDAALQPLLKLG